MIKTILIIAVVIIINISFEPGHLYIPIGSTTEVILVIYTSYTRITFNFFSSIFTSDRYDYHYYPGYKNAVFPLQLLQKLESALKTF